ncbi:LysR family transcriptional regulator [Stutzerimonas kirkiae]|uniref:LysR family transcriptional regulator n=1 Tax=Stutzerimonas kirkiae TaxID=2211392 RepID=A0A4V2KCI6_9GAMM|nr:LysR family transcriptional regulator [Stutzerimonas kirkiae]TBU94585.1 LysR family transcriptional regulator [Stutzerimonas kirkiae]TBV00730.1 LysR family transcriptional regulator [Stutzerimonas kirkiae]TBV04327.1 LysR family transcriptional regulator [Stutzerimonas kirkiae]TBV12741.1 LysR family transcriptional regulator [Stutzerimonas kirkiae]
MHIDLRQLRHFIALVEHRNFTLAAQAVNISQSAFSRSIQALEQGFGARLVDRNRNLEPTRKGLVVLEHARRLMGDVYELINDVQQFNEQESGELRFACGPAPAAWLMPRAIGLFTARLPKVRLRFQVDNWQVLSQRLLAEEFEFIVADCRNFEVDPDYQVQPLSRHRWGFCCRAGHPLAAFEEVSVEQLLSYPIAGTVRPPNLRKALVELSGKPDFQTSIECENGYSLIAVVQHSDAIGTTNISASNPYLGEGGLRLLKVAGLDMQTDEFFTHYGIISRAGYRLSYPAQALIESFLEADSELQAREAGGDSR